MKKRSVLQSVVLILLIWCGIFAADWFCVTALEKKPLFCIRTDSDIYTGLGYSYEIIVHPITGKEEYCLTVFGRYASSNITN